MVLAMIRIAYLKCYNLNIPFILTWMIKTKTLKNR